MMWMNSAFLPRYSANPQCKHFTDKVLGIEQDAYLCLHKKSSRIPAMGLSRIGRRERKWVFLNFQMQIFLFTPLLMFEAAQSYLKSCTAMQWLQCSLTASNLGIEAAGGNRGWWRQNCWCKSKQLHVGKSDLGRGLGYSSSHCPAMQSIYPW